MRILAIAAAFAALISIVASPLALISAGAQQGGEESLVSGWYRDRAVEYYDFGANTKVASAGGALVQTAPIYVFIHGMNADGTPDFVEGQHNIVDVVPGDAGYSDLWQVMLVTVPEDYEPDSVTSVAELMAADFEIMATQMFVNCPIVPEGTTLEDGEPLVQGWYRDEEVFYPDFGANSRAAIPIYVFVEGFNADGSPQILAGQQNIIDQVPGDAGYSAFWRVHFVTAPAGYVPNSIRSAADVMASGFPMMRVDMVVNCPVTTVSATVDRSPNAPAPAQPAAPAAPVVAPNTGTGDAFSDRDDGVGVALAASLAAVAGVAALSSGALLVVRRRG